MVTEVMLAPPQLAATLNTGGGGPSFAFAKSQPSEELLLAQGLSAISIGLDHHSLIHHHHSHPYFYRPHHHFQQQQQQQPHLSRFNSLSSANNTNNNSFVARNATSVSENLDKLINFSIASGIKTLKVDNSKEQQFSAVSQNPQQTGGSGGGSSGSSSTGVGGTSSVGSGTGYQSFYWLNKDPSSDMLMDKAKQKCK